MVAGRIFQMVKEILADVEREFPKTYEALMDGQAGWPSSTGGGIVRGGDRPDPTQRAALMPSPAARDLEAMHERLILLLAAAKELDRLRCEWRPGARPAGWCQNVNGCPTSSKAAKGRKDRCEACARYFHRHGRDRELARVLSAV